MADYYEEVVSAAQWTQVVLRQGSVGDAEQAARFVSHAAHRLGLLVEIEQIGRQVYVCPVGQEIRIVEEPAVDVRQRALDL